jgi:hypothetical protein
MEQITKSDFNSAFALFRKKFETIENINDFNLFTEEISIPDTKYFFSMLDIDSAGDYFPRSMVLQTNTHLKICCVNKKGNIDFLYVQMFNGMPGFICEDSLTKFREYHPKIKSMVFINIELDLFFEYLGRIVNWYVCKGKWKKHHTEAIANFHDTKEEVFFRQKTTIANVLKSFWEVEFKFNGNTSEAVENFISLCESLPIKE